MISLPPFCLSGLNDPYCAKTCSDGVPCESSLPPRLFLSLAPNPLGPPNVGPQRDQVNNWRKLPVVISSLLFNRMWEFRRVIERNTGTNPTGDDVPLST